MNNTSHRIIVAIARGAEQRVYSVLNALQPFLADSCTEIHFLFENDAASISREHYTLPGHHPRVFYSFPGAATVETLRVYLAGREHSFNRVAFIGNLSRVDAGLIGCVDAIFLTLGPEAVSSTPPFGCTLITSVFRSDEFVTGFVDNVTKLVGYGRLIDHTFLVSALSQLEIKVLSDHLTQHPNAMVVWQRTDPGLYECWNIGIRLARTDYVSNANVDDLRHPRHVITLTRHLETFPHVAVAASALVPFYQYPPQGGLPDASAPWYADQAGRFEFLDLARPVVATDPKLEPHNLPHCMPVWRRSLHNRYGWFDETRFGTYADWAYWLRVLEDGNSGWLDPEPLSFYYVNPASHNRRGTNLEAFHKAIEDEFLPSFLSRQVGKPFRGSRLPPDTPRKLQLRGLDLSYGQHRNSFSNLIAALEPLSRESGGTRFVPFLERQFVWGDSALDGEAGSASPQAITMPWIGILHVPFDTPDWFDKTVNPKHFFSTSLFQDSLPYCRGLITLCMDLERDVNLLLPDLPTLSLKHPTSLEVRMWEAEAYTASPCVVQVGDWLRKLQAIHRLRDTDHRRVMLLKQHTAEYLRREVAVFGDHLDPSVEMRELVPNDQYDSLLAQSVVLCLMYATAANNVVIECIARATPILLNPLPGVVEYLGEDYPLYVLDETQASEALADSQRILEAHAYLLKRRAQIDLSYDRFLLNTSRSEMYSTL